MFLLDTNICIAYLTGRDQPIKKQLATHDASDIVLCSVVKAELLFGARNSQAVEKNLATLARFCAPFHSLPFDDEAAATYGFLRAQLRREGRPVGGNDMMIAAIASSTDSTLVTRNAREFAFIAGLRVVEW